MKKFLQKVHRKISQIMVLILNRIYIIFLPLVENRVLFLSDDREILGGNLKSVYDYISDEEYEKVILLKAHKKAKRTIKEKLKLVYYLSTSKYILLEDLVQSTSYIKVRKGQELIQLWHGPGAFKRFGHSREQTDLKRIHKGYKKYTKAITSSEAIRPCYAEAFSIDEEKVQATGFPRTDMFFQEEYIKLKKEELLQKYPFMKNKKIILFAPTYRGTKASSANYGIENLNLEKIYNELKKENYIFIFKWHPFIYNKIIAKAKNTEKYELYKKYPEFYFDLSKERDINDLLLMADILITDYSSLIFDYVFVNKPIIYFAYDLELYENDRGMYFPFKEYVYGSVVKNEEELIKAIKEGKMEEEKRKIFKEKFVGACDGNSTKKTCEWIFENKLEK